jgi:hypothetical protein
LANNYLNAAFYFYYGIPGGFGGIFALFVFLSIASLLFSSFFGFIVLIAPDLLLKIIFLHKFLHNFFFN